MRYHYLLLGTVLVVSACGMPLQQAGRSPSGTVVKGSIPTSKRLQPFTSATRLRRSQVRTDDQDLAGARRTAGSVRGRLLKEAIATKPHLIFPTLQRRASHATRPPSPPGAIPVSGRLMGVHLSGTTTGIPHASVEIGGAGGQIVATGVTGPDGSWLVDLDPKYQRIGLTASFRLANQHWRVGDYSWLGPEFTAGDGIDVGQTVIDGQSANGQAVWIHEIFNRYLSLFAKTGLDVSFWSEAIDVSWPADSDYYAWGTVHLSEASHWDVNGHEVGHAVSDMGLNMRFGGGQHYIDRCYDETLAWSEGVASFLGLAVSVPPDDPDAKFEFMVKRRAPLRYENVPGATDPDHPDAPPVCEGPKNEWRAGAAMWDLYDPHDDGTDTAVVHFGTIWQALAKGNGKPAVASVKHAYKYIAEKVDATMSARFPGAARQNTIDLDPI